MANESQKRQRKQPVSIWSIILEDTVLWLDVASHMYIIVTLAFPVVYKYNGVPLGYIFWADTMLHFLVCMSPLFKLCQRVI